MDAANTTPRTQPGRLTAIILTLVAVVQLTVSFLGLRALLGESLAENPSRVVPLVIALSSVVIGVVFAGAVAGLLAATAGGRITPLKRLPRPAVAMAGAALLAAVAAGGGYAATSGGGSVPLTIAITAAACGLLGGTLVLPTRRAAVAGLVGSAALLVFLFLRGWFLQDLLDLLVRTPDTFRWVGILGGVVAGMCVGLVAYVHLRRTGGTVSLYGYMAAGAAPGALWLLSEIATRVAGTVLLGQAGDVGIIDDLYLGQAGEAQLNGSLATLFTGATTAVLAFGLLTGGPKSSGGKKTGKGKPGVKSGGTTVGKGKPGTKANQGTAKTNKATANKATTTKAGANKGSAKTKTGKDGAKAKTDGGKTGKDVGEPKKSTTTG